jgi:death-on-curing protein
VNMDEPEFLEVDEVLELHRLSIEAYGGLDGVRDAGLLASAVGWPQSSFDGAYAHEGIFEMAAAYLFHLARNHPFLDGNKRTAFLAAVVFLEINGITVERESEALYELTTGVAEGRIDKPATAAELERAARGDNRPARDSPRVPRSGRRSAYQIGVSSEMPTSLALNSKTLTEVGVSALFGSPNRLFFEPGFSRGNADLPRKRQGASQAGRVLRGLRRPSAPTSIGWRC